MSKVLTTHQCTDQMEGKLVSYMLREECNRTPEDVSGSYSESGR